MHSRWHAMLVATSMLLQLSNFLLPHCCAIQYILIHIHRCACCQQLFDSYILLRRLVVIVAVVAGKKDINCYFITAMSSLKLEIDLWQCVS